jgi:hypothetical protein
VTIIFSRYPHRYVGFRSSRWEGGIVFTRWAVFFTLHTRDHPRTFYRRYTISAEGVDFIGLGEENERRILALKRRIEKIGEEPESLPCEHPLWYTPSVEQQ